jgi:hypothetical protein
MCTVTFSTERNYRLKNYYARVMFSHCWYRHSRSFTVVIMIWQIVMMFLSHKWGLTSFNRFRVYYRIDTHRFWLYTGLTTCIATCAARGADHAYPSGAPDDIPGFCEVHTASVLCLWRSCSILFICFVLVISIFSFCTISVLPYFWNYDVLDYSACCFGIRLPMFVQHFTIPGSNNSFNVSSIENVESGADLGLVVRGAWVGEGSRDHLRSTAGPGQSPGSLRNYRHLFERQFWTNHTIFIRTEKLDFES